MRKKNCYLKAQFVRLKARRGAKKAIVAVAHTLLTSLYTMLKRGVVWEDLGEDYFDQRNHNRVRNSLVRRLDKLGYSVNLEPKTA